MSAVMTSTIEAVVPPCPAGCTRAPARRTVLGRAYTICPECGRIAPSPSS